jgi:type I restriction enzyme S subunit
MEYMDKVGSVTAWAEFRLGDSCRKIGSGATPRGGSSVYLTQGDVALIRSQNIYNDGFHHDGLVYLSEEHANQLSNVIVLSEDVLLNITGDSVARVCQVDPDVLPARVNQHVAIIRANPEVLWPRYLRYFLVSPRIQAKMLSLAGAGATRNALTKGMIESFEIFAPRDIRQQQAIACILGALDDKIEVNRRMNGTLEAMARAIFQDWFVDFGPVRAKAAGQAPAGLAAAVAALFPARLVEVAGRVVPEGWEIASILTFAERLSGGTPKTSIAEYWDGGVKWVSAKDVREAQGGFVIETERTVSQKGIDNSSAKILSANTTVVTARGTVGSYCLLAEPMAINQTNYGLRSKVRGGDYFVFFSLANLVSWLQQNSYGTIFDTITTSTFEQSRVVYPGSAVVSGFDDAVAPLFERMRGSLYQSRTLAALRDALLPKLIAGEMRVADAERVVARCL